MKHNFRPIQIRKFEEKKLPMLGLLLNVVHVLAMQITTNSPPPGFQNELNSDSESMEAYCRDIDALMCDAKKLAEGRSYEGAAKSSGVEFEGSESMLTPVNFEVSKTENTLGKPRRYRGPETEFYPATLESTNGENPLETERSFFGVGNKLVAASDYKLFGDRVSSGEPLHFPMQTPMIGKLNIDGAASNGESSNDFKGPSKVRTRGPKSSPFPATKIGLLNYANSQPIDTFELGINPREKGLMNRVSSVDTVAETMRLETAQNNYRMGEADNMFAARSTELPTKRLIGISHVLSQKGKHFIGYPFVTKPLFSDHDPTQFNDHFQQRPPLLNLKNSQYAFKQPLPYGKSSLTVVLDVLGLLVACQKYYAPIPSKSNFLFFTQSDEDYVFCRIRPEAFEFLEHVSTRFQLVIMSSSNYYKVSGIIDNISRLWSNYAAEQRWRYTDRSLPSRAYGDRCMVIDHRKVKDLRILRRESYERVIVVDNQGIICMLIISEPFKFVYSPLKRHFGSNLEFRWAPGYLSQFGFRIAGAY